MCVLFLFFVSIRLHFRCASDSSLTETWLGLFTEQVLPQRFEASIFFLKRKEIHMGASISSIESDKKFLLLSALLPDINTPKMASSPSLAEVDFYGVLQLNKNASQAEIKSAYKKQVSYMVNLIKVELPLSCHLTIFLISGFEMPSR